MKHILILVMIIFMVLFVGAQEPVEEPIPIEESVPVVSRLNVTIIDGMNDDNLVKLENCMIHVQGKLHIVEDTFNYSNTFLEGDRYEITIHVRLKK